MTALSDQIATDALKPQATANDGVSVTRRSLKELTDYEKFQAAKTAVASPVEFLRKQIIQVVPPGGDG